MAAPTDDPIAAGKCYRRVHVIPPTIPKAGHDETSVLCDCGLVYLCLKPDRSILVLVPPPAR